MAVQVTTSDTAAEIAAERLDPTVRADHQATQHLVRYEWAARFVGGKRVLDCASGMGYGSALLADRGAEEVVGVEISPEAVAYAKKTHARANVRYLCVDATRLGEAPEAAGAFDAIVCLETIEHTEDPRALLDVFDQLLKPDGVLILSVPNDAAVGASNPFHRWHGSVQDIAGLLRPRFARVEALAQVHAVGSSILPLEMLGAVGEPGQTPGAPRKSSVAVVGEVLIDQTSGHVFACFKQRTGAAGSEPIACLLPNGFGYVRELEQVRDRLWQELQRLKGEHQAQAAALESAQRDADAALKERDEARAECGRLAGEWTAGAEQLQELRTQHEQLWSNAQQFLRERDAATTESRRIADEWSVLSAQHRELRSQHDQLWSDAQRFIQERDGALAEVKRLAGEWEMLRTQLLEAGSNVSRLEAEVGQRCVERDAMTLEAKRVSDEWEKLAAQFNNAHQDHHRILAERDSLAVEARRLSNEWAALADELRACRRRIDIVEGDNLILKTQLRALEEHIDRFRSVQQGLVRQPLYRVMCRTKLLKSLEVPNESAR